MSKEQPLVLIAEDDRVVSGLLERLLKRDGYQVLVAEGGARACELAVAHVPDVILLDLGLPGGDGASVCRQLRIDLRTQDIPIVVVTGDVSKASLASTLDMGADDYVTKPFDPEELVARVRAALRSKRRLDDLKIRNESLAEMAFVDELTGLYNRRRMLERLEEEHNRARRFGYPVACLFLDVDHFKQVNDTHGHGSGDELLHEVATILRGCVRIYDVACRYGGEELVVILPQTTVEQGEFVAERIRATIEAMTGTLGKIKATVSIGVSEYPRTASSAQDLVVQADAAMYQAKRAGRNQVVCFDPSISPAPGQSL